MISFSIFFYLFHGNISLRNLAFLHTLLASGFLGFQKLLPVRGHLHLRDNQIARVQTDVNGLSVSLFSTDSFNMNDVLFSVNRNHFSGLFAFEVASNDLHFVVFHQRHGSNVVLSSEFFGQTGAHDLSSEVTWSVKMSFSRFSSA